MQATDYLEATYRAYAPSLSLLQGLQWPSWGALALPASVEAASALLALYALSGPLHAPVTRGIKSTVKKLEGVGDLETVYDDLSGDGDPYLYITVMLSSIATKRGGGGLIVGRLII